MHTSTTSRRIAAVSSLVAASLIMSACGVADQEPSSAERVETGVPQPSAPVTEETPAEPVEEEPAAEGFTSLGGAVVSHTTEEGYTFDVQYDFTMGEPELWLEHEDPGFTAVRADVSSSALITNTTPGRELEMGSKSMWASGNTVQGMLAFVGVFPANSYVCSLGEDEVEMIDREEIEERYGLEGCAFPYAFSPIGNSYPNSELTPDESRALTTFGNIHSVVNFDYSAVGNNTIDTLTGPLLITEVPESQAPALVEELKSPLGLVVEVYGTTRDGCRVIHSTLPDISC